MVVGLIPAQDSDFKVVLPPLPVVNATSVVSSPSLGPITHFHHACMSVLLSHLFCSGRGHSLVTDARTQIACVASVPVRQKSFETIFCKLAARKLGQETEGTLARRPPIFEKRPSFYG